MSDNILIDVSTTLENVNVEVVEASAASIGIEYFYPQGPAGSSIWGVITGTLSSQTDLWRYLSAETFSPSQLTAFLNTNAISLCSINVNGTILSAGVPLHNIFLTAETDSQTLSYVPSSYLLSISNGNTVNLSSINSTFAANSGKYESVSTVVQQGSSNWYNASGSAVRYTHQYFLPLSGGTITGNLTATNVVYASDGNSNQWNSAFTTFTNNSTNYVIQGGNTTTTALTVGTNTTQHLILETNGISRVAILSTGNIGIGNTNPNNALTVTGSISGTNNLTIDNIFTAANATANPPVQLSQSKGIQWLNLGANPSWTAGIFGYQTGSPVLGIGIGTSAGITTEIANFRSTGIVVNQPIYFGSSSGTSNPSLRLSGANLQLRLADNSADTSLTVKDLTASGFIIVNETPIKAIAGSRNVLAFGVGAGNRAFTTDFPSPLTQTTNTIMFGLNAGLSAAGTTNIFIGSNSGCLNRTGSNNIFIGNNTGRVNLSGANNIFIGENAGCKNATGGDNVFLGTLAGASNLSGCNNNFMGCLAGFENLSGSNNNFFGTGAGRLNTFGSNNNFFGTAAGCSNTTGNNNNVFGCIAGSSLTSGSFNNFFGVRSGQTVTTGDHNNFFGFYAGQGNGVITGNNNNIFGQRAGKSLTSGTHNNFFGFRAGYSITSGTLNNFFGYSAGRLSTIASCNNFFGHNAGRCTTTGTVNIAIGTFAGCNNQTGSSNVFLGTNANTASTTLSSLSGIIAIGSSATAIQNEQIVLKTAEISIRTLKGTITGPNIFIGNDTTGRNEATGDHNFILGLSAGCSLTIGSHNNFFGCRSGLTNTTGSNNNFFGCRAGASNLNGSHNNFFGSNSGFSNSVGGYNNFFGWRTGEANNSGDSNNFFGKGSGGKNISGCCNNFFGTYAGCTNITGSHNIILGTCADVATSNLSSVIVIGNQAQATRSQQLVIGSTTTPLTGQLFGNLTTTQYLSSKTIYTDIIDVGPVEFTGETSTSTTSFTATNTFVKVVIGGNNKYLRVYDLL